MPAGSNFLGDLMRQIKEKINFLSQEQKAAQDMLEEWTIAIEGCNTADEFTHFIPEASKAGGIIKMLLHSLATKKGFMFDRKQGCYVIKEKPVHA
jgi:hypothetical protein